MSDRDILVETNKIINEAIIKAKKELLEVEALEMGIVAKRIKILKLQRKIQVWENRIKENRIKLELINYG